MLFGSSIGMAKCLWIIHQTLHSRWSPPVLQTKTQPTLPSLHPTMFPITRHLQTQPRCLPLLTHHLSSPIEIGAYRGSFTGPSESRKVSADGGHLLESLQFCMKPLYPFTVYHATFNTSRRYMFYALSKSPRVKGKEMLDNTIAIYKARQEANMVIFSFRWKWNVLKLIRILTVFYAAGIEWWFLRVVGTGQNYNSGARFSGKITSAVPFGHSSVPDPDDSAESNDAAPLQAKCWCFSVQSHVCAGALTILLIWRRRWPRSLWHPNHTCQHQPTNIHSSSTPDTLAFPLYNDWHLSPAS